AAHVGAVADVAGGEGCVAAAGTQLRRGLLAAGGLDVEQQQPRALAREQRRDPLAEALRRPGYHDATPREPSLSHEGIVLGRGHPVLVTSSSTQRPELRR